MPPTFGEVVSPFLPKGENKMAKFFRNLFCRHDLQSARLLMITSGAMNNVFPERMLWACPKCGAHFWRSVDWNDPRVVQYKKEGHHFLEEAMKYGLC